jgi:acetoin utilization deacetylase AcuC-like enzyme
MLDHHPESPTRLRAIEAALSTDAWEQQLVRRAVREIDPALLDGVHARDYLTMVEHLEPGEGIARIDADTSINRHSLRAARLAAGAGLQAVDAVMGEEFADAFCAMRPPGHHAEAAAGMGFCVYNSIALAAERALGLGAERVAILDFDVHHGNGTVEIFLERPEVLVCSSFQFPFYPGRFDQVQAPNICLTPLPEGTAGPAFRQAIERDWIPALARHKPDLILVSAGFDAHEDDPLAGLMLADADYLWLGQFVRDQAERLCGGRRMSMLEGGYDVAALARSVQQYLGASAA